MLQNAAKCTGYSFYGFWVTMEKPSRGVKLRGSWLCLCAGTFQYWHCTKNDLVTFTEEILNGKLHFLCSVEKLIRNKKRWHCTSLPSPNIHPWSPFLIKYSKGIVKLCCNTVWDCFLIDAKKVAFCIFVVSSLWEIGMISKICGWIYPWVSEKLQFSKILQTKKIQKMALFYNCLHLQSITADFRFTLSWLRSLS